MNAYLTGWRLALRLARRDLVKHKARAIIALVMVTLPVLGVVAADILIQTADVSAREGVDRRLGTVATAKLKITPNKIEQSPDPRNGQGSSGTLDRPATTADIERIIGHRDVAAAPLSGEVLVATSHGRELVTADLMDPTAPLAEGLYRLDDGRWPSAADEVVVNQALLDRGVGDTLTVVGRDGKESTRKIVGTVRDASRRTDEVVVGLPGSLSFVSSGEASEAVFVDGAPITWAQLRQLNEIGVVVIDRYVLTHADEFPDAMAYGSGIDDTTVQVAALIVVMALIEVVLLAGPAIAVGARKQQRSLALLVASGGTPAQARRVILAGGVLLGVTAGIVGVAGGIGAAWLLQPVVQRFNGQWLGPFDVPWPHVSAVAAFGFVSAFVACLVPAWIASRQNVVAVIAGRRGDAKPVRAFPFVGLVLFAVGVLMAVAGARGHGSLTVAWSAVVCVLGMVMLVPVVVSQVARLAGRFPLPVRFAARDAVRHRTRTTPAVAAVAATVAGVVALGISTASDAKQNRETYTAELAMGDASVTALRDYYLDADAQRPTDWDRVGDVVRQHAPGAEVATVSGLDLAPSVHGWTDVTFLPPGASSDDDWIMPSMWGSPLGADILVSDGADLPRLVEQDAPSAEVSRALAAGSAVVFTGDRARTDLDRVTIKVTEADEDGTTTAERAVEVPARVLFVDDDVSLPVRALLPPAVADRAGLQAAVVGLDVHRPELSTTAEKDLEAALADLPTPASVYVERGYRAPPEEAILQWVLAGLGALLMLGGTLTAVFLALSDARPDLATLAAVGAAARTRRSVAAAYTFVVAFVGAVLGMLVGFVPGLAITWPLTSGSYTGDGGHYLAIPWLMITVVVVGLPLLTAGVVALCTRSRLPMVARLS